MLRHSAELLSFAESLPHFPTVLRLFVLCHVHSPLGPALEHWVASLEPTLQLQFAP